MTPHDLLPAGRQPPEVVGAVRMLDELVLSPRHSVAIAQDDAGSTFVVPLTEGRRSRPGDGAAAALTELLRAPQEGSAFEVTAWFTAPATGERAMGVDQSNESVVVGERAVVKWSVRADGGPAPQRLSVLTAARFAAMPRVWGFVRWHGGPEPLLVATAVDYLPGAVDGWTWAVQDARAFAAGRLDDRAVRGSASRIGRFVADMHRAFADDGVYPASAADVQGWVDDARAELEQAVAVMDGPEGERLVAVQRAVAAALDPIRAATGTPTIAVHGDLHVGQVLRRGDAAAEYLLVDFDGNPVLPAPQRRLPQPAAADVAGMIQSLDHVGRVVAYRTPEVDARAVERWVAAAQNAFLCAYRDGLGEHGALFDESLLHPFRLRQVCREYLYAARHLPHWRYVPDTALPSLLAGAG